MNVKKIYASMIFPFMFLLSFTSAFSIGPYLQGYVIGSIIFILATILHICLKGRVPRKIRWTDSPIIIFLIFISIVSVIIPNPKTLNYFIVYLYVFLILYLSFKYGLREIGVKRILYFNLLGVIFTSIFVLSDTFLGLFFTFDLQSYIYRNNSTLQVPDGVTLQRAYGFSNEPTNLSAYLISMGSLAIYYVKLNYSIRYIYGIVFLVWAPLILTFSGSAFAALLVTAIIFIFYLIINLFLKLKYYDFKYLLIFLFVPFAVYVFSFDNVNLLITKILFQDQSFGSGRGDLWLFIINRILDNNFMPYGLGYASSNEISIVNWYLMLVFELGLPSIVMIIAYIFIVFKFIFNSKIQRFDKGFLIFFLFVGFIQLNGYSTFYYPYAFLYALIAIEIARLSNIMKISQ